jgi:hypothetical protein
MSVEQDLAVLRLFNEKADRLLALSYWKKSRVECAVVEWKKGAGWDHVFAGADEESLEALLLLTRQFVQDNEAISLRNMRQLYDRLPLDPALCTSLTAECEAVNTFLDSESNLAIEEHRQITHREIFNIFLYGWYAHNNERQRRLFEGVRSSAFFSLFQVSFVDCLVRLARAIGCIRRINVEAIRQLHGAKARPATNAKSKPRG